MSTTVANSEKMCGYTQAVFKEGVYLGTTCATHEWHPADSVVAFSCSMCDFAHLASVDHDPSSVIHSGHIYRE